MHFGRARRPQPYSEDLCYAAETSAKYTVPKKTVSTLAHMSIVLTRRRQDIRMRQTHRAIPRADAESPR